MLFPNPAKKTLSLMILLSGIFVKYLTKNVGMIVGGGIYGGILCEKIAGYEPQAKAVELAQLGGEGLLRGTSCPP